MATLSYPSYPREYPPLPQLVPPSPGSYYPSPSPSSAADKGSMPPAEYPQSQQAPFWAGTSSAPSQPGAIATTLANASSSYSSPPLTATAAPTQTLPTPPTSDSEIPKTFPVRDELPATASMQPHVVASEPGVPSSAMLARRQNASLPAFSLPSSNTRTFSYGSMSTSATTPSLLTPPSVGSENLSPLQSSGSGLYSNMGYWSQPSPSPSSYSFASSAGSSQSSYTTAPPMPNAMAYGGRGVYSPPGHVIGSHKDRPATPGESTTPSTTYEGASFPTTVVASSVPNMQYAGGYGFSQNPSHSPSTGPLSPHEHFSPNSLPPPTPHHIYSQQSGYPYPTTSPGITSPNRPSTSTGIPQLHPQPIHPAPPPNLSGSHHLALQSRYLPGMGIPTAGLMSQHGSHMLPGAAHHLGPSLPHIHHGHPGQHAAVQQDRPFKCDQCPQSFNRNHDLKRHRRIHLAVKPFPCPNCDKSFSRKDALKRHVLVKGCGTSNNPKSSSGTTNGSGNGNSGSPSRQSVSPLSS